MATLQETLVSRLAVLSGDLQPTEQSTHTDLDLARTILAQALSTQVEPLAKPQVMSELVAAETTTIPQPPALEAMASIVERVRAEAVQSPEFLVHRRELPVLTTQDAASLPAWAAGRAIDRTLGPFRDALGRLIWIDLFRIVRQFNLVRTHGGAPFLTVPLRGLILAGTTFTLGPGSIWFASQQLAPNAPIGGYTGLRIKGGTLTFSQVISATGTELVVPPGVTCTLDVELDPPSPPTGVSPTAPGADSRDADVVFPSRVTLTFRANSAMLHAEGEASLQAYGTTVHLSQSSGTPVFVAELSRILVPLKSDINQFVVRHPISTLFGPDGSAPITGAAWALPVAVANPGTLGEASGDGALAVALGDGLVAIWKGQSKRLALGACILLVDPERLALIAATAKGFDAQEIVELWSPDGSGTPTSRLTLAFQTPFPLRFFSQGAGSEALFLLGQLTANLDRPLTLDGKRVPLQSPLALVVFFQLTSGTFLLLEAGIAPPKDHRKSLAFAAANVVLKSSPANTLILIGLFDGQKVNQGVVALTFRLQFLLPTLPDPYAVNFSSLRGSPREATNQGTLIARVDWAPATTTQLRFFFPPNAAAPTLLARSQATTPVAQAVSPTSLARENVDEQAFAAVSGDGGGTGLILLDVSTNADWFGVSLGNAAGRESRASVSNFVVEDMYLQGPGLSVQIVTVPEVQWEPVATPVPTPDDPTFPSPMTFPNSGGPSVLGVETVRLVRVAPLPALDDFISEFNDPKDPRPAFARFTLPFGIIALANLRKWSLVMLGGGAALAYNRPNFSSEGMQGGHQVSISAVGFSIQGGGTPGLAGSTIQLRNGLFFGVPTGKSILDDTVDTIFNDNFRPGGTRPQVPVTRIDLSGYGESLFSDWRNPSDAAAVVSQARFDVLVGRTSLEVIQVRSVLYPYGVRVVRTITIQRLNNGTVVRHDSGWQAVTEGRYLYPDYTTNPDLNPSPGIKTHPGVVLGIRNVTNILDTGQNFFTTKYGTQLMAARFDGDLDVEGVIKGGTASGVPARAQLGFIQLSDPQKIGLLDPDEYNELLARNGPLGGTIDCLINIGGSGQLMRVTRVGAGSTPGMGGFEFAMTAWGSPLFPQGGQWSFLKQTEPGNAPQVVDRDLGVPLIRSGVAPAPPPPASPYRFADPVDLAQPGSPLSDYGILHATGTQRVFFPRPKIEASGPLSQRITSTQIPVLADPYTLATAVGFFPRTADAIPFPSSNWSLTINSGGNYKLELPSPSFPVTVGQRTISDATSVRSYADYAGATVEFAIDTAAAVPWTFRLKNVSLATSSGLLGEVMRVNATVDASATSPTQLRDSKLVLGGALELVQDVMAFLQNLGLPAPFNVSMTNQPKFKAGLKIPDIDDFINSFLPPGGPQFADTDITVTETIASPISEAEFEFGATLLIPTPFDPLKAVGMMKFNIKLSTSSGTTFTLTWGVGIGVSFKVGPFGCDAYFVQTEFLVIGDNTIGLGVGILIKGTIDLEIISVDVSVEAKMAVLRVTCPDVTIWGAAQVTFAIEVTIAFVIDIDFEVQSEVDQNLSGGSCPLPDVL